jgi:hypothetical protein
MLGFSFSPGGLLLPYHLGVLASLSYHGYITSHTPLAGSSAGAIAVAAHACEVPSNVALQASMRISSQCSPLFLARGQLMPSLRHELAKLLPPDAEERVNRRPGAVGLAHLELFPQTRPVLQTEFETRDCLIDAVCDSCMFPFFTSNKPFRIVYRRGTSIPRVVVDGVFTEPLWRFGCPDFHKSDFRGGSRVDRSVRISVNPMELLDGRLAVEDNPERRDIISPPLQGDVAGHVTRLGRLACTPGNPIDLLKLYDDGWTDAERWVEDEEKSALTTTRRHTLPRSKPVRTGI